MPNRADQRFDPSVDRLRQLRQLRRNAGRHPVGQRYVRRDIYRNLSRRAEGTGLTDTP
ncbi:hypothetical protein BDK92_6752 [Micromonospora pisi]|uniref:Uncharacterized protein n=1 Tax=Micromonospora pisi TaxID=589240 RepID=A0A495JVG1_9ACTN|nr:hypothetical protein [Micromonospora pisi]RKR92314.1 hypothetical protein BDK92_6752 [Micromonospora pisi]